MWYIASEENQFYISHHGIKGQRWGVRRHKEKYKKSEMRKIMNDKEIERFYKYRKASKIVGNIGAIVGAAGGYIGGRVIASKIKHTPTEKWRGRVYKLRPTSLGLTTQNLIGVGTGVVSSILGKIGGEALTMAIGGYSRRQIRK